MKAEIVQINLNDRKNLRGLATSKKKIIVLEGGSGSGKTWDALYYLIWLCMENKNAGLKIMIARAKYTWLHDSVLSDFKRILLSLDQWDELKRYKRSHPQEYTLFGNTFHFRGADDPQKFHGPRWDIVYLNEAMEFNHSSCAQLFMRTNYKILLDYNPSYDEHWIYNRIIPRDDCQHILSTHLDNPALPEEQRKEIKGYEPTAENIERGTADIDLWKVYGLGQRAQIKGLIYENYAIVDKMPNDYKWKVYGLDFGFTNDPSALVEVCLHSGQLWVNELLYEKGLTNPAIGQELSENGISGLDEVVADSAEPKSIEEISNLGFNIIPATKGPDSIRQGIDIVKRYKLNITANSLNLIKERKNYKWKRLEKEERTINVPIDAFNHALDALRYACSHKLIEKETVIEWI